MVLGIKRRRRICLLTISTQTYRKGNCERTGSRSISIATHTIFARFATRSSDKENGGGIQSYPSPLIPDQKTPSMTILRMRFTRLITQHLTKLSASLGRGAFLAKSDILSATGLLPIWMGRREMRWGELIDYT